mgnify:FL=1
MKVSKEELQKIIKEEAAAVFDEARRARTPQDLTATTLEVPPVKVSKADVVQRSRKRAQSLSAQGKISGDEAAEWDEVTAAWDAAALDAAALQADPTIKRALKLLKGRLGELTK